MTFREKLLLVTLCASAGFNLGALYMFGEIAGEIDALRDLCAEGRALCADTIDTIRQDRANVEAEWHACLVALEEAECVP